MHVRSLLQFVIGFAIALAWASPSHAEEREVDGLVRGKKTLKRGSFASMRNQKISIAGRRTATVGELAKRLFADHDRFNGELAKAHSGLEAAPVVEDEVVELDDATILTTATTIVVTDPAAVRRASPEFARTRSGGGVGAKLADLDAKARTALSAYRQEALGFAADHPLRKAAELGEQELLDAIAAGKGEMRVTTTIVIPKRPLARDASGRVRPPALAADGSFDYARSERGSVEQERALETELAKKDGKKDEPAAPTVKEKGKTVFHAEFLTGFTRGDSWEWSRRWDVPTGFFRVRATAWYDYGLRVPIRVKGVMRPATIAVTGEQDVDSEYTVALSADAIDAPASFYRDVGLPESEVHGGNELVLDAGFSVTLTLRVLGIDIDKTIPKGSQLDFGQDFRPPFGDCGTRCGFDVWIPSDLTRTGFDILGIVKGSARAGVNVSGDGKIFVQYTGLHGADELKSWFDDRKERTAERKHELVFRSDKTEHVLAQRMSAVEKKQANKKYGYRLSKPRYEWGVVLTPGVRADIRVNAKPIFSDRFTIGPFWLDDLAIRLGTIGLRAHAGTKDEYNVKHGEKSFAAE